MSKDFYVIVGETALAADDIEQIVNCLEDANDLDQSDEVEKVIKALRSLLLKAVKICLVAAFLGGALTACTSSPCVTECGWDAHVRHTTTEAIWALGSFGAL